MIDLRLNQMNVNMLKRLDTRYEVKSQPFVHVSDLIANSYVLLKSTCMPIFPIKIRLHLRFPRFFFSYRSVQVKTTMQCFCRCYEATPESSGSYF